MNIIIVNHYATTPEFTGGTRHYDFAQELVSKGHNVTIIASSFNHYIKKETKHYYRENYIKENIDGINFIWIKTLPYKKNIKRVINIFNFFINARKIIKKPGLFSAPDLVIGSSVHLLAAQLGVEIAKKYQIPFYFEERDLWPQTFVDFGKIKEKNLIAKILYKYEYYFYKSADKIIVLFPKAIDYVTSKGIRKEKMMYLPNGFSTKIKVENIDSDALFELLSSRNCITYIGSHGIANELDIILNLAVECKDLNLDFVFIGEGNEKERLIKKSIKLNLNNVHFFNSVKKNQVQNILKLSKFTVISIKDSPLYKYGFSMNKLYDYFLAGKPIHMVVPHNLASNYETFGVTISDEPSIHKENLEKYLNDYELYIRASKNVTEFGEQYNWNNLTDKFLKDIRGI